ncbi:MAG TPA: TSUP family transporter, partial [Streptomyces sp.]|nr:TSUP family transporter [Streptomyces sp.]
MSGPEFTIVAVAITLASCLQASIGFGIGMLAAPVVALIDPTLVPGTIIMLAAVVTSLVTLVERTHLDLSGTGWALLGRVPGSVVGAVLVAWLPSRLLALLIAAVVLGGIVVTAA